MIRKKPEKKAFSLEVSFKDVFVCKKNILRPFIEVFIQKPQNVYEENLGTIAGILEVNDQSEESSYVVNYLISVIKKEFYSRTKRGPVESFEAALHKANLALAKLAEHETVGWVGKINAAIVAIEKNNIYFSQAGDAKALLLRNSQLTDLAEEPEEIPSPLKTFVDVVSGRLEKNDKLVITSRHIFDIFSVEEIKRSALKFSSADFLQFLKTALGNELDCAAVIYLEASEKLPKEAGLQAVKKYEKFNVFSQKAFAKKTPAVSGQKKSTNKILEEDEKKSILKDLKNDLEKVNGNFTDKKTGHIYIKEDSYLKEDESALENLRQVSQEKLSTLKKAFFERGTTVLNGVLANRKDASKAHQEESREETIVSPSVSDRKRPEATGEKWNKFLYYLREKGYPALKNALLFSWDLICSSVQFIINKSKVFLTENNNESERNLPPSRESYPPSATQKILPRLARLKNIFSALSMKQKMYSAAALFCLLVIPYFIAHYWQTDEEKPFEETAQISPAPSVPLLNDKNVIRDLNLTKNTLEGNIMQVVNLDDQIFAVCEDSIIDPETKERFVFPDNFGQFKMAAGMNEQMLIFVANEKNEIYSWSPVSKLYQTNNLELPENADIVNMDTYLSYLYLLDGKNQQIYRYPRAAGGFGVRSDWLKEEAMISATADLAVSDSVFLASDEGILKMFRGKNQPFAIEASETPINADMIFTRPESQFIYLLDKLNSRVVKTDLEGKIISQFFNSDLSQASDFTVKEDLNIVYFSKNTELFSFQLP